MSRQRTIAETLGNTEAWWITDSTAVGTGRGEAEFTEHGKDADGAMSPRVALLFTGVQMRGGGLGAWRISPSQWKDL